MLDESSAGIRGVLASALTEPSLSPGFAAFIDKRREPVRPPLLGWNGALTPVAMERTLDAMFGPTLYLLLIRQVKREEYDIGGIIHRALEGVV